MPASESVVHSSRPAEKDSPLQMKDQDDARYRPWQEFVTVEHTPEKPQIINDNIRLLGQRINAHMG